MGTYKNDYTKEEDYCLWSLHQVRNELAAKKETPAQINRQAKKIIQKYNLKSLQIVSARKN